MIYHFNQFTLDTMQYRLSNHGEAVRLEPHVFDLLQYLIEHRDRVVPRQELLDSLWKGKVVTDGVLSARLKDARKAVSDTGAAQSIIKTLYGRGYQFVAPVEENPEINDPLNDTRESDVSEQSYLAGNPSLAVLPFINLSGEPAQEVIVDGMTDEMIAGLSRIPKLLVVSYHSTMTYKGRTLDIKEVGREQGVHYVLEGSLRKMDNEIRVTAQLIDAITGHHVWADRYQGSMDDFFAFQDKIIHNVVIELQIKLVEGERARPWGSGTDNTAAWELVSRAKFLVESHVREQALEGREFLRQAIALDNAYPAAWTILGWTYWEECYWGWVKDTDKALNLAEECVQNALSTSTPYPSTYSLQGYLHMERNEWDLAISSCVKATELAPSDSGVFALLGNIYVVTGKVQEAINALKRAIRLCPIAPGWYLSSLGAAYHLIGQNDEAIPLLRQAANKDPESILSQPWLISALVDSGKLEEARMIRLKIRQLDPGFLFESWINRFKSNCHNKLKTNLYSVFN